MNSIIASINGKVIPGKQIGRTIGFHTANLQVFTDIPRLDHGVYGVVVEWQGTEFPGLMNIGTLPTLYDHTKVSYEVHILDFNKNIFHETLNVLVYFQVRKDRSFKNVSDLVKQIHSDITYVRKTLSPFAKKNQNTHLPNKADGERMNYDVNTLIHLPDLLFVQWCDTKFGINRGVFNTIDSWFYQKGEKEITRRRRHILKFILSLSPHRDKKQKIKLGDGGLIPSLNNFWEISLENGSKQNA
jgi:riboflavin kinase